MTEALNLGSPPESGPTAQPSPAVPNSNSENSSQVENPSQACPCSSENSPQVSEEQSSTSPAPVINDEYNQGETSLSENQTREQSTAAPSENSSPSEGVSFAAEVSSAEASVSEEAVGSETETSTVTNSEEQAPVAAEDDFRVQAQLDLVRSAFSGNPAFTLTALMSSPSMWVAGMAQQAEDGARESLAPYLALIPDEGESSPRATLQARLDNLSNIKSATGLQTEYRDLLIDLKTELEKVSELESSNEEIRGLDSFISRTLPRLNQAIAYYEQARLAQVEPGESSETAEPESENLTHETQIAGGEVICAVINGRKICTTKKLLEMNAQKVDEMTEQEREEYYALRDALVRREAEIEDVHESARIRLRHEEGIDPVRARRMGVRETLERAVSTEQGLQAAMNENEQASFREIASQAVSQRVNLALEDPSQDPGLALAYRYFAANFSAVYGENYPELENLSLSHVMNLVRYDEDAESINNAGQAINSGSILAGQLDPTLKNSYLGDLANDAIDYGFFPQSFRSESGALRDDAEIQIFGRSLEEPDSAIGFNEDKFTEIQLEEPSQTLRSKVAALHKETGHPPGLIYLAIILGIPVSQIKDMNAAQIKQMIIRKAGNTGIAKALVKAIAVARNVFGESQDLDDIEEAISMYLDGYAASSIRTIQKSDNESESLEQAEHYKDQLIEAAEDMGISL